MLNDVRFQLMRGALGPLSAGDGGARAIDAFADSVCCRDDASATTSTMLTNSGSGRTPSIGGLRFCPRSRPEPRVCAYNMPRRTRGEIVSSTPMLARVFRTIERPGVSK